ncbi:hypothetical protein PGB90_005484 [Kerria lacca]
MACGSILLEPSKRQFPFFPQLRHDKLCQHLPVAVIVHGSIKKVRTDDAKRRHTHPDNWRMKRFLVNDSEIFVVSVPHILIVNSAVQMKMSFVCKQNAIQRHLVIFDFFEYTFAKL